MKRQVKGYVFEHILQENREWSEPQLIQGGLVFDSISAAFEYWYGSKITPQRRRAIVYQLDTKGRCGLHKRGGDSAETAYWKTLEVRDVSKNRS